MQNFWGQILPGFTFLSWGSFFMGSVESFISGAYLVAVFVPLYNYFLGRGSEQAHEPEMTMEEHH